MRLVPGIANIGQDRGRNFDRRKHASALLRIPREDFGGAIHFGIREPRFRRVYRLGRHQRALLARVSADVGLIAQKQKRWQRPPRFDLSRRNVLRDLPAPGSPDSPAALHGFPGCRRARNWWCRGRCRCSLGYGAVLFDFHFGGRDDGGVRTRWKRRQIDFFGLPALVTQQAAGRFAARRHVTQ